MPYIHRTSIHTSNKHTYIEQVYIHRTSFLLLVSKNGFHVFLFSICQYGSVHETLFWQEEEDMCKTNDGDSRSPCVNYQLNMNMHVYHAFEMCVSRGLSSSSCACLLDDQYACVIRSFSVRMSQFRLSATKPGCISVYAYTGVTYARRNVHACMKSRAMNGKLETRYATRQRKHQWHESQRSCLHELRARIRHTRYSLIDCCTYTQHARDNHPPTTLHNARTFKEKT